MRFLVKARKSTGEEYEITREAADRFEVARLLRRENIEVVSAVPDETAIVQKKEGFSFRWFRRVSLHDRVVFADNLSAMLSAGLTLSRSLGIFERQVKNAKFKEVVGLVRTMVDRGDTLSSALGRHPDVFSEVFTAMVAAGEESGTLPQSLAVVGDQLGKSYDLRKKIRGALMYPGVIMLAMIGIGIFMMIYVVPNLTASFRDFGATLPASTRFMLSVSTFMAEHTIIFLSGLALVFGTVVWGLRTPRGRRMVDYISLRLPAISVLVQETNTATLARTLSSLIASGVDLVEALSITARVVPNSYYRDSLNEAGKIVQKGSPLATVFSGDPRLYPVLLSGMIEVGEETGKLSGMLMNTATFYESEVDAATKNLSTIIEPILMVFIGIVVGFFAVSMLQPLYSLTDNFK